MNMEKNDIEYINNLLSGTKLNVRIRCTGKVNLDGEYFYKLDNLDNGKEIKFNADRISHFIRALINVEAI
jgi:hypothetical protein